MLLDQRSVRRGTTKTNKELQTLIASYDASNSEDYPYMLQYICELITKQPLIKSYVNIGPCKYREYMESSEKGYSTMHTMLKYITYTKSIQAIFEVYDEEENVRNLVHMCHELRGNNRVPYFWILVQTIANTLGLDVNLNTTAGVRTVLCDNYDKVMEIINTAIAADNLKATAGTTNTRLGLYDWITTTTETNAIPDLAFIQSASLCADLGGGYATAGISRVLGKQFTTYDITDPSTFTDALITRAIGGVSTDGYGDLVRATPFQYFDVYTSAFPTGYDKYAITSFGFITSTVNSTSIADENVHKYIYTTAYGVKAILDLVATGAEVYCYFYSRASAEIYQNVIIQLWFKGGKLIDSKVAARPYGQSATKDNIRCIVHKKVLFRTGVKQTTDSTTTDTTSTTSG